MILAKHRDVGDDIHGGDIGGENDDAVGGGGGGRGGEGRLAESLDDFFYAALEGLGLGS